MTGSARTLDSVGILVEVARVDERAIPLADLAEAVFRGPLAAGGSEVREGQIRMAREVANAIEAGPAARLAVEAPTGCHAAGQGILMADGSVRLVESVRAGDRLMGPDGHGRAVLRLIRGEGELVDVVPVKGSRWRVNLDHVLTLRRCGRSDPLRRSDQRAGETLDVTVREWLGWSRTRRHLYKLFRVGVRDFERNGPPLPMAPYLLGALLGDGDMVSDAVTFSKPDPEIRAEVKRLATGLAGVSEHADGLTMGLTRLPGEGASRIKAVLRGLGLSGCDSGTKFVPTDYKLGPRPVRLEVLAGLLDTDGSLAGGGYDFISKSRVLAEDVAFLARSVGLAAYVRACRKGCQTGAVGTYHRVSVLGEVDRVPLRISRKRAGPRRQVKDATQTGFAVEPAGSGAFYGFTLDGDGRYLLDDFTVTHNSGKSLALLVPAVLGILREEARDGNHARVILSTAGIPLQRQIVGKDVPALSRALGIEITASVVKGRSNYACRDRLALHGEELGTLEGEEARRVARWLDEGGSGDREDLPWQLKRWGALSVTGEDCLGPSCGFAGTCIASRVLNEAATARVVVMNHAYLALAGGKWLSEGGSVALIVDEAHELEEALRNAQSGEVTAGQADHWRKEFGRATDGAELAPEELPDGVFTDDPEEDEEDGAHALPLFPSPPTLAEVEELWADDFPPAPKREGLDGAAHAIADAIRSVVDAAAEVAGSREAVRLREGWWSGERPGVALSNAAVLLDRLERLDEQHEARVKRCAKGLRKLAARLNLAAEVPEGYAVWVERERGKHRVNVAPIAVKLPDRSVPTVLCSATLGAGHPAEAAAAIGIEARELVLPHPWPVERMGVCLVPRGPGPKDPRWAEWCDRGAVWFARQCGGGVLVLASSRARMGAIADALRAEVPWRVRVQGEAGRTELVDWFREDEDGILVGTASFRQGLDVAGRACRGVVIDRIPFPSPGDPLEEAIAEQFADGFRERSIPVAAQALRQSVGRLLRTVNDRGAICVLDPRLAEEPWARRLREAIGPIPVSRDPKDVRRVLDGLPPEGVIVEKPRTKPRAVRTARS